MSINLSITSRACRSKLLVAAVVSQVLSLSFQAPTKLLMHTPNSASTTDTSPFPSLVPLSGMDLEPLTHPQRPLAGPSPLLQPARILDLEHQSTDSAGEAIGRGQRYALKVAVLLQMHGTVNAFLRRRDSDMHQASYDVNQWALLWLGPVTCGNVPRNVGFEDAVGRRPFF